LFILPSILKMNYPALKGWGIPFGASSFSGFYPYPAKAGQGIPAAKIKQTLVCLKLPDF